VSCLSVGDESNLASSIADLPYKAYEHHRELLQSMPSTTYPLEPVGHPAEVSESQRVNDQPFGQR